MSVPFPFPVLDRAFDDYRVWTRSVIEKIKRGEAAPRVLSFSDIISSGPVPTYSKGMEADEERALLADRRNAPFMNDQAIANRRAKRALLKIAYEEALAERRAETAEIETRKASEAAEMATERLRVQQEWEAGREAREAMRRREAEEWNRPNSKRDIILRSKWQCQICQGWATVEACNAGWLLTCQGCGKEAFATATTMDIMLNLRSKP